MGSVPRNLAWIALLLGWTAQVLAQGGPPLLTDDPGTPGHRNWEINIASTHFRSPGEREIVDCMSVEGRNTSNNEKGRRFRAGPFLKRE